MKEVLKVCDHCHSLQMLFADRKRCGNCGHKLRDATPREIDQWNYINIRVAEDLASEGVPVFTMGEK